MSAVVEFETIPELFTRLAAHYDGQNRPALRYKDDDTNAWEEITWEALRRRVWHLASYLHKKGVRAGDRVAILSENRPEWVITDLATQVLGAVNVSAYTSLPADQVRYILKDAGARLLVVSRPIQLRKAVEIFEDCPDLRTVISMSEDRGTPPAYVCRWEEVTDEGRAYWQNHKAELTPRAQAVEPDDLCALVYTSGTTGRPKGVMLSHRNVCSNARAALRCVPFSADDHHLSFLPLCHSFERTAGYIAVLAAGATITYAESIEAVNNNLLEVEPTVLISVPRLFEKMYNIVVKSIKESSALKRRLFDWSVAVGRKAARARKNGGAGPLVKAQQTVAHRLVFSKLHEKLGGNLRFAVSGGAALPKEIGDFFEAAGVTIVEGYGLTETAPVLTINPIDHPRYGTVGQVLPGVTIAIQRRTDSQLIGRQAGDDYPSNLTTNEGELLVKGPNVMKGYWNDEEATRAAIDEDGWYHTGDVGRFEAGYLAITDRLKHMIVSKGGKNIYPGPIEDAFKTEPLIDQMLIVGEGRAFLTALVVPDLDALQAHAAEQELRYESEEELLQHEATQQFFNKRFRAYSRKAASHEKVRNFRLLAEPFTVENGMLTPTMKPKRRVIEHRYAEEIDDMYAQYA